MMPLDTIKPTRAVLDTLELEKVAFGHDIVFPTKVMAFYAACYEIRHGSWAASDQVTKFQLRHDPEEGVDMVWGYTPNDPGDDGEGWHQYPQTVEQATDGGWHIGFWC